MPLYEYRCTDCNRQFEVRASFQEKVAGLAPVCPDCQSANTRQLISGGLGLLLHTNSAAGMRPTCGPDAGPGCCGL